MVDISARGGRKPSVLSDSRRQASGRYLIRTDLNECEKRKEAERCVYLGNIGLPRGTSRPVSRGDQIGIRILDPMLRTRDISTTEGTAPGGHPLFT